MLALIGLLLWIVPFAAVITLVTLSVYLSEHVSITYIFRQIELPNYENASYAKAISGAFYTSQTYHG